MSAIGEAVGDVGTQGFPTMSADSVSNSLSVVVGTAPTADTPADPTNLVAVVRNNFV